MEALFYFLVEVVLYGKGYWSLRLLSLGRIDPRSWNDGLVSLVGFMVTLAWSVPLLLWMTGRPSVGLSTAKPNIAMGRRCWALA